MRTARAVTVARREAAWSLRVASDHHDADFERRSEEDRGQWRRREWGLRAATHIVAGDFRVQFPAEPSDRVWRLALLVQIEGECRVANGARRRTLAAGEWMWVDPAMASTIESPGLNQLLLETPRRGIPASGLAQLLGAAPAAEPSFSGALAGAAVALATGLDRVAEAAFVAALDATLVLGALAAGMVLPELPARGELRHLQAALTAIASRADDPALSPARVADAIGLSRRRLDAIFAWRNETIDAAIHAARLRRAAQRLADPQCDGTPIIDIALQSGFSDHSSFSRRFRRRFGCTPREFRERGRVGPRP